MKVLITLLTLLFALSSFAHEVEFPLTKESDKKDAIEACDHYIASLNKRLTLVAPGAMARAKVEEDWVWIGGGEVGTTVPEYTCLALVNNIPGEVTLKKVVFSKKKHKKKTGEADCSADAKEIKSTHPNYALILYSNSKAFLGLGKMKCTVEGLEAVKTISE